MIRKTIEVILVWVLSMLGLSKSLSAQELSHWNLTVEDGLSSMTVYDIVQDDVGYMWIGTSNGLCRYDGTKIVQISKKELKDGEILNLVLDDDGRVWFSNLSGQLAHVDNGVVKVFDDIIKGKIFDFEIIDNVIYLLLKDLEMDSFERLVRYEIDHSGALVNKYYYTELFSGVHNFCKVDSSLYWAAWTKGLGNCKVMKLTENKNRIDISDHVYHKGIPIVAKNKEGTFFVDYKEHSLILLKDSVLIELFDLEQCKIHAVRVIDKKIYILSSIGVFTLDGINKIKEKDAFLKKYSCNSIFIDREKNSWISTEGDGVLIIPKKPPVVFNSQNSDLLNNKVSSLLDDQQQFFVGLKNGGLVSIDTISYKVIFRQLDFPGPVSKMIRDNKGNYWVLVGNECVIYNKDFNFITSIFIVGKDIVEDENGEMLVSSDKGFFKINYAENLLPEKNFNKSEFEYITQERTYAVLNDFGGKIWLGTTQGLTYYSNDSLYQYTAKNIPSSFNVSNLIQSADSVIWVSTLEDGLIGIKENGPYKRYNIENGLSSNTCRKVFCKNDKLWIATDKGINVVDRKTDKIVVINETDGLPTKSIEDIIIKDDKVWVATLSGLATFPDDINTHNSYPPPIIIKSFQVWNRDTTFLEKLVLDHQENNIFINYSGLAFRARGDINYKYKLSGVDNDWVKTSSRSARYPKLQPGDYKFEVYAINEDGVESKSPAVVSFVINIAWWNSWWLRLAVVLCSIFVLGAVLRYRWKVFSDKDKMRQDFKVKVNALRQEALQTQMNPHFIFNSLNGVQQFITTDEPEKAINYLASFASLVRMIFEHSKRKTISFDEELDFLRLYLKLENLRFKGKIVAVIHIEDDLLKETYNIKLPPLLIQPLIENAFKHGLFHKKEVGKLTIDFFKEKQYLVCKVTDNGIGRASVKALNTWKSKNHKSSGIKTSRERLEIINGAEAENIESLKIVDLKNEQGEPVGTQVILKINCIIN